MNSGRTSSLQTRKYGSLYTNIEATCPKCGKEEETLEHVILECKTPQDAEYQVQKKLGLHGDSTPKIILGTSGVATLGQMGH